MSTRKTQQPPNPDSLQQTNTSEYKINTAQAFQKENDTRRLVQEIEVHQIELEMQNEELRRAHKELELSRNAYAELYEFAPVGYFTVNSQGIIQEVNRTGAQLLGADRQSLVHTPINLWCAEEEDRALLVKHFETVHAQGNHTCEVRLRGKDDTEFYARVHSVESESSSDRNTVIHSTIINVSDRRRVEDALQKAYSELDQKVQERTEELIQANTRLLDEIIVRKDVENALRTAFVEIKHLKDRLVAENTYLQQEVAREFNFGEIIGQSHAISNVFHRIEQVAPQDTTVLLLGETGTGKGVVARAIHARSARKNRPMITVNCSSLPANLIESELFGRERGAFTGANARQIGRFELADGGTIFLDEIGEMPLELQSKLLRVIQDGEFEHLGSPRTIKVNVRIIAASNRDLQAEIKNGKFRNDLFYRLNVFPILIPPLRQRTEDIGLLVNFFVAKFNKKIGKQIENVSRETLNILQAYNWPGNVRELESVIERAAINSTGTTLQVMDRFESFRPTGEIVEQDVKALAELEHDYILRVLKKTNWRIDGKNGAALLLDMNPSTLRARMRKLGIRRQYKEEF